MRPYYWFQSFAIFPDKHDAVIDLDEISIDIADGKTDIELSELVTDKDNIDANIKLSILDTPALMSDDDTPSENHAEVSLRGKTLTVLPKSAGNHYFTLAAESNGRSVTKTVAVNVGDISTGIGNVAGAGTSISCDGYRVFINGFSGHAFRIYDVAGRQVASFDVDCDKYVFDFGSHTGIYIVTSDTGISTKVIIR